MNHCKIQDQECSPEPTPTPIAIKVSSTPLLFLKALINAISHESMLPATA